MPEGLKRTLGNQVRRGALWAVQGEQFRRYAPQSAPASKGDRLRIAIPYLIPNLGDAVMTFPLIDAIRRDYPDAEISAFTHRGSGILAEHPDVDHSYSLTATSDWREVFGPAAFIHDLYRQWKQRFRQLHFHSVVMLRAGVDPFHAAHLGWMLGGRDRSGYSSLVEPERGAFDFHPDPLLTRCIRTIGRLHEAERGAEVLEAAGLLRQPFVLRQAVQSILRIAQGDAAQAYLYAHPELQQPYAIVAPGSSFPRRRWEAKRFAEVVRHMYLPRGWMPVIVGGKGDEELAEVIEKELAPARVLNLIGTSFGELAAVCAGARCFIGNDSGTGHVAGACGIPTLEVAAFREDGPATHHSSPLRTHPVGPYVRVIQPAAQEPPCTEECMMDRAHCILGVSTRQFCDALEVLLQDVNAPETLR